jgi:hypothetical protein
MHVIYYVSGVVVIALLASLAWVNNDPKAPFLVLILACGAMGAVVREHVDLRSNVNDPRAAVSVGFSPVMGAIVALVLMALFLSGLISGDLFPKFVGTDRAFETPQAVFRGGVTLVSNSDFYKMIAWSILAGYSERFVLSKLDALTSGSKLQRSSAKRDG